MKSLLKNIESLPKPKAILLDWDNTLADSWKVIHKCLNVAFKNMGHEEWSLEDVKSGREGIHQSLRQSFPKIFGDKWEEAKQHYFSAFLECHIQEISLLPNAINTIKQLHELDAFIAIVSNKTGTYLRNELNHLGISKYFNEIVGATDAERDKPYKEPLIYALKHSNIAEAEYNSVWMVGDSATDIEAAINTGVVPILYGKLNGKKDEFIKYEEKAEIYQVESQEEFQHILSVYNQTKLAS